MVVSTEPSVRAAESIHEPCTATVSRIRRHVRALLIGWELAEERIDDAILVIEELVANVVDHARTEFRLRIMLIGARLHLAVRDGSDRFPELRPFDATAVRGRGLQLVDTLARRWGCDRHPDGKTVWAVLAA